MTEAVLHRALGLTDSEAAAIRELLDRPPNDLELAMYAVMWSEHCSYKSSRRHLRRLPSEGPDVLVGPGENAGVIDGGDGVAIAIRIESHNHPSAIEPYQGAATGVGGILRDIFTMGARPIALMDSLWMGPLEDAHSRWIFRGVVGGISGYGNAVGVPTVGGEVVFGPGYAGNPLVNVLCLGVMPASRLVLARATGAGNLALLLGSTTGRDGIGGVSVLASAGFEGGDGDEESAAKRPSVQVGDPYGEKRLIEACLELLDRCLVVGLQDLGGAGLTCATSETASRAGMGMDVNVADVPRREPGMAPYEVMTSESQERMLAVVRPEDLDSVLEVCRRWEVRAAEVGRVTEGGRLRVLDGWDGPVLADVPASSLAAEAPAYDRPVEPPADLAVRRATGPGELPVPGDCGRDLCRMVADPSWVYRQYDHQLFLNTVVGPGEDAAVLRLAAPGVDGKPTGPRKGLALTTDGNSRWCALDPRRGTAMVVAEAALNLACVGARPAALVNCLNFGNPEHPEVMWQLSEAIDGMAEASRALSLPVVGGNVSLYNESGGRDIDPTPVVGALGLIGGLVHAPPGARLADGGEVLVLGKPGTDLAGSRWAVDLNGCTGGQLPHLDLEDHARLCRLVAGLVAEETGRPDPPGVVLGIHDVSDGGLAVTLAEMAVRSGVALATSAGTVAGHGALFSEAAGRVVICTRDPGTVTRAAGDAGVPWASLGRAGGSRFVVHGLVDLSLGELVSAWHDPVPAAVRLG